MPIPLRILLIDLMPGATAVNQALRLGRDSVEIEQVTELDGLLESLGRGVSWDLIVANPQLPGCTLTDCQALLQERHLTIPIIAVCPKVNAETLAEFYAAGAQAVVDSDNLQLLKPTLTHILNQTAAYREQLRLNQTLYKNQNRYRTLLKNSPVPSITLREGEAAQLNDKAKQLLGIDSNTSAETVEKLISPFIRLAPSATPGQRLQTLIHHLDGSPIQVEVQVSKPHSTSHAMTQIAFDRVREKIRPLEDITGIDRVFDPSRDGVVITDGHARIIAANKALEEISGYTEQEIIGKNPEFLKSHKHDDIFYQELLTTLGREHSWQGKIWCRRKDDAVHPCWLSISTLNDEADSPAQYVAILTRIYQPEQTQNQQSEFEHLAHHDPLTNLPNRLLFEDRLEHAIKQARRHRNHLAVFFLDLDRFKNINDSLGHIVGDALLKQVAMRLLSLLRENDTPARLGGDEFTILVENLEDPNYAAVIASKIQEQFQKPFRIFDRELHVSASIGISIYPEDGEDVGNLTKNADAAMYKAKESGSNSYRFYTAELTKSAYERLLLESELRTAIREQQLLLYYQPQFSLTSGKITGAEALLRWRHPRMGVIPPSRFVPLAEETGLIHDLGHWVLEQACIQTFNWTQRGLFSGRMAVNLSVRQIMQTDLILQFEEVIEKTGCPPEQLQFEVTEGIFMGQMELSIPVLEVFKKLGVTIAIDDFGTGYSSLSYLKQLPIDKLKIDRSFIKDMSENPDDAAIVQTIISLGKNLGISIIAEGVETHAQQELLQLMGCQEVQGYLYGIPVPPSLFEENLISGNHSEQSMRNKRRG